AWLKRHHPDAFLAALLNSQPMGFYAPAQLVRDAREHGVEVRPVDVLASEVATVLEAPREVVRELAGEVAREVQRAVASDAPRGVPRQAPGELPDEARVEAPPQAPSIGPNSSPEGVPWPVRLGLDRIAGLAQEAAARIVAARAQAPFESVEDLARRAQLDAHALGLLARADALASLAGHRHQAAWGVAGVDTRATPLLQRTRTHEAAAALPAPGAAEAVLADYRATGLSLVQHPLALLRAELAAFKVQPAAVLRGYPSGRLARASGIVTHRQRPETARGVVFVTLEDETGAVNVIVWPQVAAAQRRPLLASTLLTVYGVWQAEGAPGHEVRHLVARRLVDHSALLQGLATRSRNFR
ncbi:MAG TPA: error-prone DNA polymerase, partial [Rubrivivax sp.]|nr:error-prone DNA polymerase [Rubrivivax sp.]